MAAPQADGKLEEAYPECIWLDWQNRRPMQSHRFLTKTDELCTTYPRIEAKIESNQTVRAHSSLASCVLTTCPEVQQE
jgi:hypothetical protein